MKRMLFLIVFLLATLGRADVFDPTKSGYAPAPGTAGPYVVTSRDQVYIDGATGRIFVSRGNQWVEVSYWECEATPPTGDCLSGARCTDNIGIGYHCKDGAWDEDVAKGEMISGTVDLDNGGTGKASWVTGRVPFISGTVMGEDAGLSYDAATDTLTVGGLVTADPGDNLRGVELTDNTTSCPDPAAGATSICTKAGVAYIRDTGGPDVALSTAAGTVTSVALSMPGEYSVAGSPITGAGTFTVTAVTQTANTVYAGPASGGAAVPAFRAIADDDVPDTITVSLAATATALAADPADCAANEFATTIAASGALTCASAVTAVGPSYDAGVTAPFSDGVVSNGGTILLNWEGQTDDDNEVKIIAQETDPGVDYDYTLPLSTTTIIGTDTADALTNKTLDVEATGNVITIIDRWWVGAGSTDGTLCYPAWVGKACTTAGSNFTSVSLTFLDAASSSIYTQRMLSTGFTGTVDLRLFWSTSATTGNAVWQAQTACVESNEATDPSPNTASTVTDAAVGTANAGNIATITSVTITGCQAGEFLLIKLTRDPAHASDTISADAKFYGAEVTIREAQ